ncbi:MAG: HAD family hydrolase [Bryobacteraceae bacterium]|nr:HAD family hydrolase [Bryobacteraceae bacterium]
MAANAIIFDLDGTIWDSLPWYAKLLAGRNQRRELPLLARLQRGESVVTLASLAGISRSHLATKCLDETSSLQIYSGVRKTLQDLTARGTAMGVVTSLSGPIALAMLNGTGLAKFFSVVVHPGNCRASKSSGIPIRQALRELGLDPGSNIYNVGDRDEDARGATAGGVSFAWASYGYGGESPLGCVVIDRFEDILLL